MTTTTTKKRKEPGELLGVILSPALKAALRERAAAERRSLSAMAMVLIEDAMERDSQARETAP